MSELVVDDVDVAFGERTVLDGVDLTVAAGEIVALLGPSGSGKSTLLRVIAGLVTPDRGTVRIDGVDVTDVPTHRRGVGMVFQDEQLFEHLDVAGNVAFGLRMRGDAAGRPAGSGSPSCSTSSVSPASSGAASDSSAAARPSGSRWPARWRRRRACCCSTSR